LIYDHTPVGATHDRALELISLAGSMVLSFITLYSIKFQVWHYEKKIRRQKNELEAMNDTISREKEKLKESNRVRDKLFSIISHDLRVPIQGLHLMLSNESHQEAGLAVLAENLPELRAELKKTSQLFDDLLDWSRLQISNNDFVAQKINMPELASKVRETLHYAAFEKDIRVEVAIKDNWMYADRDMMEIVLRNLLSNAIKFTPCDGTVVITGLVEQDTYLLRVEDSGTGIDAPAMEKIMEREFYTSSGTCSEKGSGLGLIICSELVEKCRGYLSIHSTIGKGTLVSVSIPHPQEALPETKNLHSLQKAGA
jgi:signal transduction histidine kinase